MCKWCVMLCGWLCGSYMSHAVWVIVLCRQCFMAQFISLGSVLWVTVCWEHSVGSAARVTMQRQVFMSSVVRVVVCGCV